MAKKKSNAKAERPPSFEEAFGRLEEIVHVLEEGDVDLSEALARYEEGVTLLRHAYDLLQHAQRRVEFLSGVDAEGNPVAAPFDAEATLPGDEERRTFRSERGDSGATCPRPPSPPTDVDEPGGLF